MGRMGSVVAIVVAFGAGAAVSGGGALPAAMGTAPAQLAEQQPTRYLYIEEFTMAAGQSWNASMREVSGWVRDMRATGEFRSVRLYSHHTGPAMSFYVHAETDSWQAIDDGFNKFFAARPGILDEPFPFSAHSDNLLSEIIVD
jgi:hypothetical protein